MSGLAWNDKAETTNRFWLSALWLFCRFTGRTFTRYTLLVVITIIYFCADKSAREMSRTFLARVKGNPSTWMVFQHLYTFALVTLDRLFILSGQEDLYDVEYTGDGLFDDLDKGAILVTSHFGSFEIMRVLGKRDRNLEIHILLDKMHNSEILGFLTSLNPEMADQIVDAATPGPNLVVELSNLLDQNHLIGIMADRTLPGQRTTRHSFFGENASFPLGPFAMAVVLKRPIIFCFGTFTGGNQYRLAFERLDPSELSGKTKTDKAVWAASHYAKRLEYYVRGAPLNWFNFYDFWADVK